MLGGGLTGIFVKNRPFRKVMPKVELSIIPNLFKDPDSGLPPLAILVILGVYPGNQ